jgi:hypothetical protein
MHAQVIWREREREREREFRKFYAPFELWIQEQILYGGKSSNHKEQC